MFSIDEGLLKIYIFYYDFSIGRIGIAERNGKITNTFWGEDDLPPENEDIEGKETPLIRTAAAQLREYGEGRRKVFDLPLEPEFGTLYMRSVWKALCDIPYGETASYRQIAAALGNPKAARAVGLANNRNPLGVFVPCHRVIGSNGKLLGYAGGLAMKEKLLTLEYSVLAAKLEIEADAKNSVKYKEKLCAFSGMMEDFTAELISVFPDADEQEVSRNNKQWGDPSLLAQQLEKAIGYLEGFEADEALSCLNRLLQFVYGGETDELLVEARNATEAYAYEEAIGLLRNASAVHD